MTYNSRLFNEPKLRRIVEVTDNIAEGCGLIADALADYENAGDLPSSERGEARDQAREDAWNQIGELLSYADDLRALRDTIGA